MLGRIDSWSTVREHSIEQRVLVAYLVLDLEDRKPTLSHVPILSWSVSAACSRDVPGGPTAERDPISEPLSAQQRDLQAIERPGAKGPSLPG